MYILAENKNHTHCNINNTGQVVDRNEVKSLLLFTSLARHFIFTYQIFDPITTF